MKRLKALIPVMIILLLAFPVVQAQEPIYLPLIFKAGNPMPNTPDPILRVITQDGKIVDLLEDWEISDPYWRPKVAGYKNDGNYVDSAIADGGRLVSKNYANVVETIPLVARGTNQAQAINKIRELLQVIRQAADYWTEPHEYDYAWLEARPACNDCRTGYARIVKANVPELNNPFGQPFFSSYAEAVMDDLTLIIEREPLWRGVQPGTLIGPLYNVLKNPDFELWNFGVTDSQPDSWSDLESAGITGTNNRDDDSSSGDHSLRVRVSQSTAINRFKGVSQVVSGIRANTEYTIVAWVRNGGVSNGVARILVTYSSQLEVYRSSSVHGWQLYTGTFTTGPSDTVAINLEILSTAANTDGTVYFDSLMILEGDWEGEALDGMLPYMTSSHIVNHWDQAGSALVEAGDINYVDMWNVPGDESGLVKLEMVNNTPDSSVNSPIVFETIRAGMRRARDVTQFVNFYDPSGVSDTTASGNNRVNSGALSTTWATVGFFTINDPDIIQHNLGRFRVLARVWDASTSGAFNLEVRLRYWIGQAGVSVKTLDSVTVPGRGSWYTVDLTGNAALNWGIKTKNLPGTVGIEIQMRRATGTDQGYLDYAMILPTDGGVLFATINPSVPLNSGLVVDNTNSSDVYGARMVRGGWRQVYNTTTRQGILKNYNEALYIANAGGHLHRFQNNGGTFLHQYDPGVSSAYPAIEVFNSKLFVLRRTGASGGQGYSTNGQTFPGTLEFTFGSGAEIAREVIAFQGHLYFIGSNGADSKFWDWDGVSGTATERLTDTGLYNYYAGIGTYRNKIYFGGGRAAAYDVFEYDPATGLPPSVVTTVAIVGTLQNGDFVEFNGMLYWMTGAGTDNIYRFDGSTWTAITPLSTGAPMFWNTGVVAGDRLYIGGNQGAGSPVNRVMSTADGVTWRTDYTPGTTAAQSAFSMEVSQGQIFMAIGDTLTNTNGDLHVVTFTENQYKGADYQLSEFRAPNREWGSQRRHRYFFSFDRENGVNVADDAMLVGIGVVPQYLSLVGEN